MEALLTRLFDFQAFENNRSLQKVIDAVHARYAARELNPDEMEYVSAASGEWGPEIVAPASEGVARVSPCSKCGRLNSARKVLNRYEATCVRCGHSWWEY